MIKLSDRILYNNGISVVSEDVMLEFLVRGELPDTLRTKHSRDTDLFKNKFCMDLTYDGGDIDLNPEVFHEGDDDELIQFLVDNIRDDTNLDDHLKRIDRELDFFIDSNNLDFLHVLRNLVKRFKSAGVITGVGRGSSCASYILYLLEVHDINPIHYNINFNEFSKEGDE